MTFRPLWPAAVCSVFLSAAALASPFEQPTFDAATEFEVKFVGEYEGGHGEKEWFGPALDITFPIVPRLETSLEFGRAWEKSGGASAHGFSDLAWAAKWEIVPKDDAEGGFYVSTEPAIVIPTGANGFSEKWAVEAPLLLGRNVGEWKLRGMALYSHPFASGGSDEATLSFLAFREISETFGMGVEWVSDVPLQHGGKPINRINLGIAWEVVDGLELTARVGHTVALPGGETAKTNFGVFLEKAF